MTEKHELWCKYVDQVSPDRLLEMYESTFNANVKGALKTEWHFMREEIRTDLMKLVIAELVMQEDEVILSSNCHFGMIPSDVYYEELCTLCDKPAELNEASICEDCMSKHAK